MKHRLQTFLVVLILGIGALLMMVPFVWMIITSLKTPAEALQIPPDWWPRSWRWHNYLTMWHLAPFGRYCLNSLLVTTAITVGQLVTGILAAFALTHLQFYGRRSLFIGLVGLMMIPGELLLIPNFVTLTQFHWIDTYAALIVPWLASIFVLYALRQSFQATPRSRYYAARIDGASDWQYLWQILVPANRTTIVAVAVLQAIGSWNSFMWPLIVTNSDALRTLPVGLIAFTSDNGTNYPLLMAASTFVIGPLLVMYLVLQKYIVAGMMHARLKG